MEIKEGTTNMQQFRRTVLGLRDAREKITFRVGKHVTLEIAQGGTFVLSSTWRPKRPR
jgi:hypothetical protein